MIQRLFSNTGIYLGANILNAGIPFLLLPVFTRVLTPADYGIVAMFGIVLSIFSAFTGLSVHGAVGVRYFQLDAKKLAGYVGTCLVILVISTATTLVILAITGEWIAKIVQLPIDWLLIAVIVSGAQFVINIRLSLWRVQNKAVSYGLFQILQSLLNIVLSLYLVLSMGMAWQGRLLGQSLAVLLTTLIGLYSLVKSSEISKPLTLHQDAVDALQFGVPLIPHVIGNFLISTIDRFMIANLMDLSQAGVYTVTLQIGMALNLLAKSFNDSYAPWLMQQLCIVDAARDRKIVRGTYVYFLVITLLAITLGILAPQLLAIMVGERFRGAAPIVIYITMGYAFNGMYFMVTNYIFFANKTSYLAWMTFSSGLFNIIMTYVLITANGLVGAAQAFMLSQLVLFCGTWILSNRAHYMPWNSFIWSLPSKPLWIRKK